MRSIYHERRLPGMEGGGGGWGGVDLKLCKHVEGLKGVDGGGMGGGRFPLAPPPYRCTLGWAERTATFLF